MMGCFEVYFDAKYLYFIAEPANFHYIRAIWCLKSCQLGKIYALLLELL